MFEVMVQVLGVRSLARKISTPMTFWEFVEQDNDENGSPMGISSTIPAGGKSPDVRDRSIHLFESLADARNSQNALAIQPAERPTNDPAMTSLRKW